MAGRGPPPQQLQQRPQQPPMQLLAQHGHGHPQTAADLPLSITALMHVLRDAEHLTARYGSTSVACARLEELEHAHIELQAQLAALQQKLSMAMVAAVAAQADHQANNHRSGNGHGSPHGGSQSFSADALLAFLQRQCACRGNLAQLHGVLHDFERSLTMPRDTQFPPRDVLLSVHEIVPVAAHDQQLHQPNYQPQYGHRSQSPQQPSDMARKKKSHELSRLTTNGKLPGSASSSPARVTGNGAAAAAVPRAIAPAGRSSSPGGSGNGNENGNGSAAMLPPPPVDRRARQEEKQTANAAIVLSALSRPSSDKSSATATGASETTATLAQAQPKHSAAAAQVVPTSHKPTTGRQRSSGDAVAATATTTGGSSKRRSSSRRQDEEENDTPRAEDDSVDTGDDARSKRKRTATSHVAAAAASTASATATATATANAQVNKTTAHPTAAFHEIVVKQNLSLPHDKRNVVELKQSSQLLTLAAMDELTRRAPWDDVYKLRAQFSRIVDFQSLQEPARKWYIGVLRVQFVWRREYWERLHWLPMSESICVGAEWDKLRQTRKRRANKAISAWRKVYNDSLELMRQRLLPEDVWCDVSLWYMPSTPLYWLPGSADLLTELLEIDTKHPVRSYFVNDFRKHPFYNDHEIQLKYPQQHELPSPQLLALQHEDKESRVNITPE